MFDIHVEEIEWAGRTLRLETGRVARQADGAVLVTYGETTVLATVVADRTPKPGLDFFPLTVNYQEKTYAAGKIPGGFFKREARPSEKETLVSRLIDRPIRPLFAKGFKCETQVILTVLSHDLENDPDIVAMVGASAALVPVRRPVPRTDWCCRVGYIDGEYVVNPTLDQMPDSVLNLVVAGTQDAVLMVESEAQELSEEIMLGAVMKGHEDFQPVIEAIIRLAERARANLATQSVKTPRNCLLPRRSWLKKTCRPPTRSPARKSVVDAISAAKAKVVEELCDPEDDDAPAPNKVGEVFKSMEAAIVRGQIIDTGSRIDGRGLSDVRQIKCEVGVLPRTHGSALFTRGETQALVVTTLGTGDDEQFVDALEGNLQGKLPAALQLPAIFCWRNRPLRFHQPPRSRSRQTGLARSAPDAAEKGRVPLHHSHRVGNHRVQRFIFNGQCCGASLAMMDAGVPLHRPIAGIAMGLILKVKKFAVLVRYPG